MSDRRYTYRGCGCGDAFCAGCDDESWTAAGDSPAELVRGRSATFLQRYIRREEAAGRSRSAVYSLALARGSTRYQG